MTDPKTPPDPFEAFRRLWGPLGMPVPGMAMPTLDPEEVDKRIADLRSVETWLSINLNMVRLSMQGLEVQKAALLAMRGNMDAGKAAAAFADLAKAPGSAEQMMMWPWAMMQQSMSGPAAAAKKSAPETDPAPENGKRPPAKDRREEP